MKYSSPSPSRFAAARFELLGKVVVSDTSGHRVLSRRVQKLSFVPCSRDAGRLRPGGASWASTAAAVPRSPAVAIALVAASRDGERVRALLALRADASAASLLRVSAARTVGESVATVECVVSQLTSMGEASASPPPGSGWLSWRAKDATSRAVPQRGLVRVKLGTYIRFAMLTCILLVLSVCASYVRALNSERPPPWPLETLTFDIPSVVQSAVCVAGGGDGVMFGVLGTDKTRP